MKMLKKIMAFCLTLTLVLCNTFAVCATELAGDKVTECNVFIVLSDQTGNYSGETLNIYFKDITGTAEGSTSISKGDGWGAGDPVSLILPAPTTYTITFEGVAEGYQIIDTFTGIAAETSFGASEGNKFFYWSFAEETENRESVSDNKEATSVNRDNVTVQNEEAEEVYREFLEAISFIETDESWYNGFAALLNQYDENSMNHDIYCNWYADYVQGGSVEKFFEMSSFEQFLWTETYTRLANAVNSSWGFDHYFGSKAAYKTYITDMVTNLMSGNNSDVVKEAYLKMMDWQYEYITENGVPFNFINNRNYIEEIGDVPEQAEPVISDEEELESIREEMEQAEIEVEEKGVWSDTMELIAQNAFKILLLVVLIVAFLYVKHLRKSRNIDDK